MKGLFLASSRRVLSLIDFKLGFGNLRHLSPRFSLRRPSHPYLSFFCVTFHDGRKGGREGRREKGGEREREGEREKFDAS